MIDAYPGYYSPNETMDVNNSGQVHNVTDFLRASLTDCKMLCFEIRRYFMLCFDRDFLASTPSRRDMWRLLLPLPGVFALIADRGNHELMFMDAALAVTLFMLTSLPQAWILSDIVFCLIFGVYITLHSVFGFEPTTTSMAAGPALATVTMVTAGINTWINFGFVIISYCTAPYVAYGWTMNELLVCFYVLFLGMLMEQRATAVYGRSGAFQPSGYKALISAEDASRCPADLMSSRYTAEPLPSRLTGAGSDNEDMSTPLPRELQSAAFLDRLMARFRGDARGPMSSIFSQTGVTSTASHKARFNADKVAVPEAAVHEAPYFPDKETADFLEKDIEAGGQPRLRITTTNESLTSLPFPGSPTGTLPGSPASSCSPTTWKHLRAVKLGGFQNDWLNVLFVERQAPQFRVNQRETYWPASGAYFIYRSVSTNTWGIAKAKRFQAVKEARSNGVAHSPEGYELWLEVNEGQGTTRKTNWREWDTSLNKWVARPGSGVLSRGKVRPKLNNTNRQEAETQTEFQVSHRSVQTIASQANAKPGTSGTSSMPGSPKTMPSSPKTMPTSTVTAPVASGTGPGALSSPSGRAGSPQPKAAMAKSKGQKPDPTASLASSAPLPRESDTLPVHMAHGPVGKSHHRSTTDDPRHAKSTETLLGLATESQEVRRPSVRLEGGVGGSKRAGSPTR